jgi:hypothetical protein
MWTLWVLLLWFFQSREPFNQIFGWMVALCPSGSAFCGAKRDLSDPIQCKKTYGIQRPQAPPPCPDCVYLCVDSTHFVSWNVDNSLWGKKSKPHLTDEERRIFGELSKLTQQGSGRVWARLQFFFRELQQCARSQRAVNSWGTSLPPLHHTTSVCLINIYFAPARYQGLLEVPRIWLWASQPDRICLQGACF